jgi:hypothetical protein
MHPHAAAVEKYLEDAGITPETLRYAATHESLCRSWIFDLLMNLATSIEEGAVMADNIKGIPFSTEDEGQSYPEMAKDIVQALVPDGTVYLVWFAYILGNWKALCSTDVPDGRYFEVTFSKERGVAFVDTYVKVDNVEVEITA